MIEKLNYWLQKTVPNVYDDSMSLYELMEAVRKKLDEVIDVVNGYDAASVQKIVEDMLQEWYDNGKLADIINNSVFSQINADIDDLKNQLANLNVSGLPFVNVADYMSKNKKEFTEAFQDCLKMAMTGGIYVFIPPGTYQTTAELNIYSNTFVHCAPGVVIKRNHDGYLLLNGERGKTYSGYTGNGNIGIVGGLWDINGVSKPSTATGFCFAHASDLVFRDLTIKDSNSHCIELNSSQRVRIENVKFLGLSAGSENLTAEAIQLDFAGPDGFPAFGYYDKTHCKDITVLSCYFGASGSPGTSAVARALGSHGALMGRWHDNIVVDDCTCEGLTDYCFNVYNYNNFTLCNSKLLNSHGGVILYVAIKDTDFFDVNGNATAGSQDCRNFDIYGNLFSGIIDKNHIRLYGREDAKIRNVKVKDNIIENAAGTAACVYGLYFESVLVEGNVIENIQDTAIAMAYGNELKIINNRIKNMTNNGISVTGAITEVTIADNSIQDVASNGILISDNVLDFVVKGNRTKNVNRSNSTFNHMHIVNACSRGSIVGNVMKDDVYKGNYALYITNTCSDIVRDANVFRGVGSIRPVYDTFTQSGGDLL